MFIYGCIEDNEKIQMVSISAISFCIANQYVYGQTEEKSILLFKKELKNIIKQIQELEIANS